MILLFMIIVIIVYLGFKLNEEMYPYTIKQFDFNIKACLQHINWIDRDAKYVGTLIKAKESKKKKEQTEEYLKAVKDIIKSFNDNRSSLVKVYKKEHIYNSVREDNLDKIMSSLKDLGFDVSYEEHKEQFSSASIVGILTVSVETK